MPVQSTVQKTAFGWCVQRDDCNLASSCAHSTMSPSPQKAFLVDPRVSQKHVWLGMVLGEMTDGLHLPQHAKSSTTHASCRAQVSESVLVGLAREHHVSVAREPPSCSLQSRTDVQWSVKTLQHACCLVATILIFRTFPDRHCRAVEATFCFSWVAIFECIRRGVP